MKSRTFYSAIALFAGLLVLIGAVGFWGLTAQNPRSLLTQGGQEKPVAAQFVPRQAPVMVSLLARPDRLWRLRQLLTPADQRAAARQEWQSLQQSFESWMGWDYEADVRPWLNQEVSFAVTAADLDHDVSNGLQAGYLAVLSCRDTIAAQEALHLLWQQRAAQGRNLIFETVAGIALISDQPPKTVAFSSLSTLQTAPALDALATAMVGDRYVLLANDSRVLRQAITTYRAPDISLAKSASYREAIATLPANRVGWVAANLPSFLTWLGSEDQAIRQPIRSLGQRADFAFISFKAFSGGLLGNTAIAAAPGLSFASPTVAPSAHSISPRSLLAKLPEDTLFATVGTQLSERLATLNANIGGYQFTQQALRTVLDTLSLDADLAVSELSRRLGGVYALGYLPGTIPSWLLMSQTTGAEFAEVDAFAETQGLTISHLTYEAHPITVWTRLSLNRTGLDSPLSLQTQVVGVHTPLQGYEVLATSFAGLQQVWEQSEPSSLGARLRAAQLIEQLDSTDSGLTYLNWPALSPLLLRRLPWLQAVTAAGQPFAAHIGPVLISGYDSPAPLQTGAIAIKLVKNQSKSS